MDVQQSYREQSGLPRGAFLQVGAAAIVQAPRKVENVFAKPARLESLAGIHHNNMSEARV